jgi:hypothetical protein
MSTGLAIGLSLLTGALAARGGEFPRQLLSNSDFEHARAGSAWPDDWPHGGGARWLAEGGNHFLRLEVTSSGRTANVNRNVQLEPEWGTLRLSCRARFREIVPGKEGWHDGRIAMSFLDAGGKRVGPWPNVLHWSGSSTGWLEESRDFVIPEGATQLGLSLALYSVERGTLDLDDVQLSVLRPRPKPEDLPLPDAWKPALAPSPLEQGPVRETLCLNGAWQFRPMGLAPGEPATVTAAILQTAPPVPATPGWGWTKLPAAWPETFADAHQPLVPEFWLLKKPLRDVAAYWYRRTVEIPRSWGGRRILLGFDMPQTQVSVLVDRAPAGTVRWPSGQVDLTSLVKPGHSATLTLFVTAEPFDAEQLSAAREDLITKSKADVRFRGLCGDILLTAEPLGPRLARAEFQPSVRRQRLGLRLKLADAARRRVKIRFSATLQDQPEIRWTSPLQTADPDGQMELAVPWLAKQLWDLDAPRLYEAHLELLDARGKLLDEVHRRLGFREIWIEGRDLMLNGAPIHWRALNFSNLTTNLGLASKPQCAATLRRMRRLGFNFAILSNYGFTPGETASFGGLLDAADEQGFLLSFSLPHPFQSGGNFNLRFGSTPAWQKLTEYCIATAEGHPCVLAYAMSHNTLGYHGDQNPAKIDGRYEPRPPKPDAKRPAAAQAEAFVRQRDPTRLVYHHQSGNMGQWHTVNIYLNWAPAQERMEWLSHWADAGVKPVFFVEWGLPHQASWGRHRVGPFIWRNKVNSEPLAVEYGAAIFGDSAYALTADEERHIDTYERVYARGQPFHISQVLGDYFNEAREHNFVEVKSAFTERVWPALRTWGISALLPWDQSEVARRRPATRPLQPVPFQEPPETWNTPGVHPDMLGGQADYFRAGDPGRFEGSSLGTTFLHINADVLLWIAGSPDRFTEQSHLFRPGQTVRKQLIVLNDTRGPLKGRLAARVQLGQQPVGTLDQEVEVPPGGQRRVPWEFSLPAGAAGNGSMEATLRWGDREAPADPWAFEVLPAAEPPRGLSGVVLWDPKGLTAKELSRLGIEVPRASGALAEDTRALLVGREALTVDGELPEVGPLLARGGRVVVFEQTEPVLSRRLGFRTNAPSLRNVFLRTAHPILAGLGKSQLHDWCGDATLLPDRFTLPDFEATDPKVDWLGFRNPRVWKWGNAGQLASVVPEKPQTGDFLSLVDGGFDLQYSPLLLARTGGGQIVFCQLDVTGRSQPDPAADRLLANLVGWAGEPAGRNAVRPPAVPPAHYVGDTATLEFLRSLGAQLAPAASLAQALAQPGTTVAAGAADPAELRRALAALHRVPSALVLLWPTAAALEAFGPALEVRPQNITHTLFRADDAAQPWLAGVGPAELHFRGRTSLPGVFPRQGWSLETGVVAAMRLGQSQLVFCQIDPRQFDYTQPDKIYLKLTRNRSCTLLARVLANSGVALAGNLETSWRAPATADPAAGPGRWLHSFYLDAPVGEDDPYRYNRW